MGEYHPTSLQHSGRNFSAKVTHTDLHRIHMFQVNGQSVCAMYAGEIDRSPFLFTGGTDMRLRYWDLTNWTESYLAVPSALDTINSSSLSYEYVR